MKTPRLILLSAAGLIAACAAPPALPPPPPPPAPAIKPALPPPPEQPAAAPPPVTETTRAQAQRQALGAVDLLQQGNEEAAKAELQRALVNDPNNKLAVTLMRQISADPVTLFGRDSFAYTVRAGESLSAPAKRYLGDVYLFYGLARYNDIKVPRQVAGGQVVRIPGKAPVAAPASPASVPAAAPTPPAPPAPPRTPPPPTPTPAPAAKPPALPPAAELTPSEQSFRSAEGMERAGDLPAAMAEYRRSASLGHPSGDIRADALRKRLVTAYTNSARGALAKQDLPGAIAYWNRVLELEPGNQTATLERQRAIDLQERLKNLGGNR